MQKNVIWRTALLVLTAAMVLLFYFYESEPTTVDADPTTAGERVAQGPGEQAIAEAFAARRSGVMVEAGGIVEKTLADDLEGSRHQRFIVKLNSGQTLLISHNIDLAPRIPLSEQDAVEFRGQYEWNERGGVVHWTHHDPQGNRAGGWIRHLGRTYR